MKDGFIKQTFSRIKSTKTPMHKFVLFCIIFILSSCSLVPDMNSSRVSFLNPLGLKEEKLPFNKYTSRRTPASNFTLQQKQRQQEDELTEDSGFDPEYSPLGFRDNDQFVAACDNSLQLDHIRGTELNIRKNQSNCGTGFFDFITDLFAVDIEPAENGDDYPFRDTEFGMEHTHKTYNYEGNPHTHGSKLKQLNYSVSESDENIIGKDQFIMLQKQSDAEELKYEMDVLESQETKDKTEHSRRKQQNEDKKKVIIYVPDELEEEEEMNSKKSNSLNDRYKDLFGQIETHDSNLIP